jgi:hypothetical protein
VQEVLCAVQVDPEQAVGGLPGDVRAQVADEEEAGDAEHQVERTGHQGYALLPCEAGRPG